MAALRLKTAAIEGRSQANGGLVPSTRILVAREEAALAAVAANGAVLTAKPRDNTLPPAKVRKRTSPKPLLRVAVFASVALNVTTLALLLHHYANHHQRPAIISLHQHHHTCLLQSDASGEGSKSKNGAPARQEESRESVLWAPSTGKPAVTPDSVINLDQESNMFFPTKHVLVQCQCQGGMNAHLGPIDAMIVQIYSRCMHLEPGF